ncbi:hypothetical protein Goklo_028438 [Gossypium klotzschianum]|uniref:Uncharacterized protein n=2 Tax=Gossypium TaxID=3633 RepID=A0A7J8U1H9_9ROSI|nr:hypothetical protein [Gossypium klotzschianum]
MEKDLADLSLDDKEEEILQSQLLLSNEKYDGKSLASGYRGSNLRFGREKVHDVPLGLRNESLARQLGDFLGKFVEYNSASLGRGFRNYLWHGDSFCLARMSLEVEVVEMGRDLLWDWDEGDGGISTTSIDPLLGLNLEDDLCSVVVFIGEYIKSQGQTAMDHDLEESAIEGG